MRVSIILLFFLEYIVPKKLVLSIVTIIIKCRETIRYICMKAKIHDNLLKFERIVVIPKLSLQDSFRILICYDIILRHIASSLLPINSAVIFV